MVAVVDDRELGFVMGEAFPIKLEDSARMPDIEVFLADRESGFRKTFYRPMT